MGILQGLLLRKPDYSCSGERIILRAPKMDHFTAWCELRQHSKAFLEPWEPLWQDDEILASSFRRRMGHYARLVANDAAFPFFIFAKADNQLLGAITLSNVRRGVAQMATLGYWTGERHANTGVMTDALQATMRFARDELELHRLEAACLPDNEPSIKLLERAGFDREGFAQAYLKINGRWEDHILWGRKLV
jgi:[ribosomal protein S5]-alanine N-acetyltransferase